MASADLSTVSKTIDSGFVPVSSESLKQRTNTLGRYVFPKSLDCNIDCLFCPGQVLHGDAVLDDVLVCLSPSCV